MVFIDGGTSSTRFARGPDTRRPGACCGNTPPLVFPTAPSLPPGGQQHKYPAPPAPASLPFRTAWRQQLLLLLLLCLCYHSRSASRICFRLFTVLDLLCFVFVKMNARSDVRGYVHDYEEQPISRTYQYRKVI